MNPLLIRRRGMIAAKTYRLLEYAIFDGAKFHLDYYPNLSTQIDANIKNSNNENQFLWWAGGTVPRISSYITSGNPTQRFGAQSAAVPGSYFIGNNITLQHNKSHIIIGTHTYNYSSQSAFTATDRLYFGGAPSANAYHGAFRFMQVSEDGVMLFDLVAAERSDGVVGYLDQVNGTFYQSETAVQFTAGPYI